MKIKNIEIPKSWKIFWLLITISIVAVSFSLFPDKKFESKNNSSSKSQKIVIIPTTIVSPTKKTEVSLKPNNDTNSLGTVILTTPIPTNINSTNANSTNTNSSNSNTQSNELHVNLSINKDSSFSLTLPTGSNQCDVLSQAQRDGKIHDLNMKYISNMGSYGVYQINDIGQENQVWWVYKVNGTSPSQGCDHVKVNNNDSVNWQYLGSN